MSSHPGSTLKDAVLLAEYLHKNKIRPEQVQDFYPTPGTVSTCMYYTGLDPYTLKPVFVEKAPEGKALQRALLQYYEPRNASKVIEALRKVHREDLIPVLTGRQGASRPSNPRVGTPPARGPSPFAAARHSPRPAGGSSQHPRAGGKPPDPPHFRRRRK